MENRQWAVKVGLTTYIRETKHSGLSQKQCFDKAIEAYEAAKVSDQSMEGGPTRKNGTGDNVEDKNQTPLHRASATKQPDELSQSDFLRLMVQAGFNVDAVHPANYDKFSWSTLHGLLQIAPKRESGWVFITFDEKGSIRTTPAHEQEVLFVYGESVYAGCFLDDIRESHYPDGEKYEGDFGFYTNDDKFFEAENVRCWMPSPAIPKSTKIEDREPV